ncbi:MAG TPA: hypothetical protein VK674_00240 [Candidatus Limnocylindria bacterium]|nr:hypothetical protein [Candidatus Limnocylindria bacterium]
MQLSKEGFLVIEAMDDPVMVHEALDHSIRAWEDIRPGDSGHTSRALDGMGLIGGAYGLPPIPDLETQPPKDGPATIFLTPGDLALCLKAYRDAIAGGQVELDEVTAAGVMLSIDDDLTALRDLGVSQENEAS